MKLIALLAGLLIERLATELFHLRQLRWLDSIIDAGFRRAGSVPVLAAVVGLAVLLVLPLVVLLAFLDDAFFDFAYLVIAIVVLFFSFGPKDIGEQVDDYCSALEEGDAEAVRRASKALLERDVPDDAMQRIEQVEAAVCIQANNRLFAVVFWFVLFGPLGAWAYRVTDLIRRRAVFNAARDVDAAIGDAAAIAEAASTVHGWLVWVPARLTALGYALAGSFDSAYAAWRHPEQAEPGSSSEQSEHLLARVGVAALAIRTSPDESPSQRGIRGATAANALVFRLLGIWAVVIAAMTLYGWSL